MVLERIISIREAIKNPWWMFVVGGLVSVLSLVISFIIFPASVGLFTTFLITLAMTPFMINLITYEEAKEEEEFKRDVKINFLERHREALTIYTAFFTGMIIFMSIIFIMLPNSVVQNIFQDQINEIKIIRGNAIFADTFQRILVNNIGVLTISFLFSFLFGAGAIFILSWNASVLATAIGLTAQSIGGIKGLPMALIVYLPHGSLEILAYFIGGIAGGIVSAVISKRKSEMVGVIVKDGIFMMFAALAILAVAAVIETTSISLAG